MPDLTRSYPELKLHVSASVAPVDFQSGTYDLAVRHFDGQPLDLQVKLLLRDEARVYCSPEYRERLQLSVIEDMVRATVLYTTSHANWSRWLGQVGMSFDRLKSDLRFDQSEMAIDAARRSQGIVLTSPWLVEDDVAQGSLVQLFPHVLLTGKNYYLVHSNDRPLGAAARQLFEWLAAAATLGPAYFSVHRYPFPTAPVAFPDTRSGIGRTTDGRAVLHCSTATSPGTAGRWFRQCSQASRYAETRHNGPPV